MIKKIFLVVFLLYLAAASIFSLEPSNTEILIKSTKNLNFTKNLFEDDVLNDYFDSYNISLIEAVSPSSKNFNWYLVRTEEIIDYEDMFQKAKEISILSFVQRNTLSSMNVIPNDPLYSDQRIIMELINLPQAWDVETGSEQVIVAVVDSGILLLEDLQNNIFINENEIPGNGIDNDGNGFIDDYMGYDFVDAPGMSHVAIGDYLDRDPDPTDENFHGTHVSGIIAADTNNYTGIAGTAWNVKILPIRAGFKTTGGGGFLEDDDAAAAMLYAANMGAHIINCSWGDANFSQIIKDAVDYCVERGVVIVAAAGNSPGVNINYPARFNNTIAVGAVDNQKRLAGFSSYGPELDIVAPGVNILSTFNENQNYFRMSGTSMAAPFVSGAVALLLSKEPGLDVFQVKQRLIASAEDLGDPGFDNFYGYGLLDVRRLLDGTANNIIDISSPTDHQRFNSGFIVRGTVKSPKFLRYSLMFTDKQTPQSIDWKDINTHQNSPVYFYTEVDNGVLGEFYLPSFFMDGLYRLRLKMEMSDGSAIESHLIFFIDRNLPELKENTVLYQKRYNKHLSEHFIFSLWNKEVSLRMEYKIGNNSWINTSVSYDSLHILKADNYLQTGDLSVRFTATDLNGQVTHTDWQDLNILIKNEEIPETGFIVNELAQGLILTKNAYDFNQNQRPELIALRVGDDISDEVFAVEYQQNALSSTFVFTEKSWPLDISVNQQNRKKLASLRGDYLQIYESLSNHAYPDFPLWSLQDVNGAIFADFTNNGNPELIAVRDLAIETGIEIYKETLIGFDMLATISNPTPTSGRRMFVPKIQAGNLDNNGKTDLLTADIDGDIMIWEYINNTPTMVWSKRLPVLNTYFLNINDFTGDGHNEFIAGGYITSEESSKTWWYFEMFKALDSDEKYSSLGNISFSTVRTGQNSIYSMDLNSNNQAELVLALTPYLYVISYTEDGLKPIFWTECDASYQISGIPENEHHTAVCIFNKTTEQGLRSFALSADNPFTGPATPTNLHGEYVNDDFVQLYWESEVADYYNVYFKLSENEPYILKGQSTSNDFSDNEIPDSSSIIYSVSSVVSNLNPSESYLSTSYKVVLEPIAQVEYLKMIGKKSLLLSFDKPIHSSCVNMSFYSVNHGIGVPSSVHFFDENRTLFLTFFSNLHEKHDLTLSFTGLKDANQRLIPDQTIPIQILADTEPPFVVTNEKMSDNQIALYFSEKLDPVFAKDAANFHLEPPVQDLNNYVKNVSFNDSLLILTLANNIVKTISNYYLSMSNIRDLAGNLMSNQHNRISLNLTEIRDLTFMVVYPNPLNVNEIEDVKFKNLPLTKKGDIKIFNLSGDLVYRESFEGKSLLSWSAKNNSGQSVSAGLYYYIITAGSDRKKGKIAVIR